VNKDDANMLEGAMRAAITANANGEGKILSPELIELVMKVVPKLMQNSSDQEEMLELQKENTSVVQQDINGLSRRVTKLAHTTKGLYETQKGVLEELRLMRELQSTIVAHLARVEILDIPDDDDMQDYDDFDDVVEDYSEGTVSNLNRRRKHETTASNTHRKRSRNSHNSSNY